MHCVIYGGGAIGLSVAWHLLPHARVTVVDVPKRGAASPASAGMLAPFAEAKAPGPMLDLGVASLRMWLSFAEELGVKLHGPGMLRLGANDAIVQWARANGFVAEAVGEGVFTPDEKNVDPPALLAALRPHLRIVHEPVEGGILLAPITGKLLAEMIITGKTPELLKPCDPLR